MIYPDGLDDLVAHGTDQAGTEPVTTTVMAASPLPPRCHDAMSASLWHSTATSTPPDQYGWHFRQVQPGGHREPVGGRRDRDHGGLAGHPVAYGAGTSPAGAAAGVGVPPGAGGRGCSVVRARPSGCRSADTGGEDGSRGFEGRAVP